MTSVLFQPFHLHDLTLPNRIVLAPLTRSRAGTARLPNRLMAEYYSQRSSAGLLITEATSSTVGSPTWSLLRSTSSCSRCSLQGPGTRCAFTTWPMPSSFSMKCRRCPASCGTLCGTRWKG